MVLLSLSTREQCDAYTSAEMIPLLRSLSPEFGEFFAREGRVLHEGKPIYWIGNETAPPSIQLQRTENGHVVEDNSSIIIVLQHLPSRGEDVYIAAHELGHVILGREGFPFPRKIHGNGLLAHALYAMIQDPLVNLRLLRYGFAVAAHYATNVNTSLRVLGGLTSPTDPLDRLLWSCNMVGILLDGEYSRAQDVRQRFRDTFFREFPDMVPDISILYAYVKDMGFDTPDQQRRFIRGFSRKYNLYLVPEEFT